jgi:GTPase SAR1 family protein
LTGAEPFIVEGIKWAAPKGWGLLKSWWLGKEILIVGQARAGKTTLRNYLQLGEFDDAVETEETPEIEETERFQVTVGNRSALKLFVSRAIDSPGQVGAVEHANYAYDRNPHALIIVLDLTTPFEGEPDRASGAWLRRFCKRYETLWRANPKNKKNRVKAIMVLMNKADKLDQGTIPERTKEYRDIVDSELKDAKGKITGSVGVFPCSVVTNPEGEKLVNRVVDHLTKAVARS